VTVEPDDRALRETVLKALAADSTLAEAKLEISVERGVVTLRGVAPCWADRRAAECSTYRIVGVRAVVNCIDVVPVWTSRINHALR
jgi:osmotically-inducible protein OsmY